MATSEAESGFARALVADFKSCWPNADRFVNPDLLIRNDNNAPFSPFAPVYSGPFHFVLIGVYSRSAAGGQMEAATCLN